MSESYVTNASGISGSSQPDYITFFGLNTDLHEHSRRVSLDATYIGGVNYYDLGTEPTQITNNLQAVGNVTAIPDYLKIVTKAFAQPVVISNLGIVTADGSVVPNGFRNSYGYSAGPDLTFVLGDFATSETTANYGGAYFSTPAGSSALPVIPGLRGPEDTVMRTVTEKLSSGPDFSRLTWTAVGLFSEVARQQGLLSEKAGTDDFRYAVTREISLLATGGYDAITNTTPFTRSISGPVALGGFALTFGEDFSFEVEAGQKYNSASYIGNLRYNLSPSAMIVGAATDYITTPEGQLLNSLSDLTAAPDGTLTGSEDLYSNGTPASLSSFSAQPLGGLSFNQNIARYQRVSVSFEEDLERNHANVSLFGMKLTELNGAFIGPPTTNSWGSQVSLSHDFTRLLIGTIGGNYSVYQELGGSARTFTVQGQLAYSLSQETRVYLRSDYLERTSSSSLQALSPLTGSVNDLRVTIGLSHTL